MKKPNGQFRRIELTGRRFGRLVVLQQNEKTIRGELKWLCLCDCGARKSVVSAGLRYGRATSCGCYSRELSSARASVMHDARRKYPKEFSHAQRCAAWRKNNRGASLEIYKRRGRKDRELLRDSYLRNLIRNSAGIPWALIPMELISAKRAQIHLLRLLKEKA